MHARFDLFGAWTDAAPYFLEHPGAVINLQLPQFKVIAEEAETYEDNLILSACYKVLDIRKPLRLINTIPISSGLGGSSIVAAEIVKTLNPKLTDREIVNIVLTVEEEIGTCGGWQDVIGGMYPGIKLTQTNPDKKGYYQIEQMPQELCEDFLQHCLLIDTGGRRTKPSPIMKKYAAGDKFTMAVLDQVRDNTLCGWEFLKVRQYFEFASLMERTWRLTRKAEEVEPVELEGSLGYKTAGAAGGSFIFAVYENRPKNPKLPTDWKYWTF